MKIPPCPPAPEIDKSIIRRARYLTRKYDRDSALIRARQRRLTAQAKAKASRLREQFTARTEDSGVE